jgi:hypothetical protein
MEERYFLSLSLAGITCQTILLNSDQGYNY